MRGHRGWAGMAVAGTLLAVPAAASAQAVFNRVPVQGSGAITLAWHANPATCGATGLCAYSGTVTTDFGGSSEAYIVGPDGDTVTNVLDLLVQKPGTARVRRESPDGPQVCVDTVAGDPILDLVAARNRLSLPLDPRGMGSLLSSGRCAGPLPADFAKAVISRRLDFRKIRRRRPVTVDFSGQTPWSAGPFAGELISTLKVSFGRARYVTRSAAEGARAAAFRGRALRTQELTLDYAIDGVSGSLTTAFAGLPAPGCTLLDACGAAGTVTYTLAPRTGKVSISGYRGVHGDGGGLGLALLAMRQGRMDVTADVLGGRDSENVGMTSERVTLPGGPCTDTVSGAPAVIQQIGIRPPRGTLRLGVWPDVSPDLVRTRCQGPSQTDVAGDGPLAAGAFDMRTMGAHRIDLPFRTRGTFAGTGYGGSTSGAIVLHLRLRHARAKVTGR